MENRQVADRKSAKLREEREREREEIGRIVRSSDYAAREEEAWIAQSILDGTCEVLSKDRGAMGSEDWVEFMHAKKVEMRLKGECDVDVFFECFRMIMSEDRTLRNEAYVFAGTCIRYQPSLGCEVVGGHDEELLRFLIGECRPGRLTGWVYETLLMLVQCHRDACSKLIEAGLYDVLISGVNDATTNSHLMLVFQCLGLIVRATSEERRWKEIGQFAIDVIMKFRFGGGEYTGSFVRILECLHFVFLRMSFDVPLGDVWLKIQEIFGICRDLRSIKAVLNIMGDLLTKCSRDLSAEGDLSWMFDVISEQVEKDKEKHIAEYGVVDRLFYDTAACSLDMFPASVSQIRNVNIMFEHALELIADASFDIKQSAIDFVVTLVHLGPLEQYEDVLRKHELVEYVANCYNSITHDDTHIKVLEFCRDVLEYCVMKGLQKDDSLVQQFTAVDWDSILSLPTSEEVSEIIASIVALLEGSIRH